MKEKITKFDDIKVWPGKIDNWFRYTAGVTGEKFLQELKENKRLMATKCPKCERSFLPPRMYCEDCMEYTTEWVEIKSPGQVETFTVLYQDLEDKPLENPKIVAFITWHEVEGGLIHEIGEIDPDDIYEGMAVEPVFKDERNGSITDILYFRPISIE